jgi:hypothetical protein
MGEIVQFKRSDSKPSHLAVLVFWPSVIYKSNRTPRIPRCNRTRYVRKEEM